MIRLSKPLILASASPRRQELLNSAGYIFDIIKNDTDENPPIGMKVNEVAEYLAIKKAKSFAGQYENSIILTADTVVVWNESILDKPNNEKEATQTLKNLSGKTHEVITGVAFLNNGNIESLCDTSKVYFKILQEWEINYYVKNFRPFDKAGGYGIQEWIGMIGIEKIEGSYFNVMGLPIHLVHNYLSQFRMES